MVKKTGVIILNYNNSQDTINCINSFLAVNKEPYKIVVVDNGSRKEKFDVIIGGCQNMVNSCGIGNTVSADQTVNLISLLQ